MKKSLSLIIVTFILIMAVTCPDVLARPGGGDYYPLTVGNRWVYETQTTKNEVTSSSRFERIINRTETINGTDCFVVQSNNMETMTEGSTNWYARDANSNIFHYALGFSGERIIDWTPPHLLLLNDLTIGTTWENVTEGIYESNPDNVIYSHIQYSVEDTDATVEIKSGTYSGCLKIHETGFDFEGNISSEFVMYYAKNIGMILYETSDWGDLSYREELVEYSIAPTAVEYESPITFTLSPNHPNPFNPTTSIPFTLAADSKITLTIYNIAGEKVATLADGNFHAGSHSLDWDASSHASGVYFYKLTAGNVEQTRKMTLVK